jgi:hypothetical protein
MPQIFIAIWQENRTQKDMRFIFLHSIFLPYPVFCSALKSSFFPVRIQACSRRLSECDTFGFGGAKGFASRRRCQLNARRCHPSRDRKNGWDSDPWVSLGADRMLYAFLTQIAFIHTRGNPMTWKTCHARVRRSNSQSMRRQPQLLPEKISVLADDSIALSIKIKWVR